MNKTILYIGNDLAKESKYNSTMETLGALLSIEGFSVIKSSSKKNQFLRLIDMCFSVIKYRKKIDYILIDTFSTSAFYFSFLTSQIARFFNLKYIPILHGGNLPNRLDSSISLSKKVFNYSYKNVAPSNYLKTEFKNRNYKVIHIPNSLEIEQYHYKKKEQFKAKLLWVRAFKALYNPTLAIEVLKLIKEDFINVKLCMVGPIKDDTFNEVKKLVEKYNLKENIEFTGVLPKEDWHKKSKEFDIFINTTNVDNTPVSVMEAMALGLPVVSTNVGGLPYLIDNKVNGLLVDKNNPQQITQAIIDLIDNKYPEIQLNAREKVESFSWEIVRKEWLKILK